MHTHTNTCTNTTSLSSSSCLSYSWMGKGGLDPLGQAIHASQKSKCTQKLCKSFIPAHAHTWIRPPCPEPKLTWCIGHWSPRYHTPTCSICHLARAARQPTLPWQHVEQICNTTPTQCDVQWQTQNYTNVKTSFNLTNSWCIHYGVQSNLCWQTSREVDTLSRLDKCQSQMKVQFLLYIYEIWTVEFLYPAVNYIHEQTITTPTANCNGLCCAERWCTFSQNSLTKICWSDIGMW